MPETVEIASTQVIRDGEVGDLIGTDGLHTYCEWRFYVSATRLLAMNLTPVMASLTETGDVWSVFQA